MILVERAPTMDVRVSIRFSFSTLELNFYLSIHINIFQLQYKLYVKLQVKIINSLSKITSVSRLCLLSATLTHQLISKHDMKLFKVDTSNWVKEALDKST